MLGLMHPSITDVLLAAAAFPALLTSGYLATLALVARRSAIPAGIHEVRFDVVVPAHNEANGIAATIAALLALDYPRERYRILVVADNCTDRTAAVARDAGALVLVRQDPEKRGKGYALAHAFERCLSDGEADAVVVVDADSLVSANMLSAFGARFAAGAECVQAEYGVRNVEASWRTRLMAIAFALYHTLRSLGRERLGFSCGLRGNGMGFALPLLRRVPHRAFSVVEDVEYGIALGLAGVRVAYVAEVTVLGEMPASDAASRSQRERWEGGRWSLIGRYAPALLRAGLVTRNRIAFDLLADLLVPPLTTLASMVVVGSAAATLALWVGKAGAFGLLGWLLAIVLLGIYVARGCAMSGAGLRAAADLLWAPVYGAWKLTLMARPALARRGEWIRTERTNDE